MHRDVVAASKGRLEAVTWQGACLGVVQDCYGSHSLVCPTAHCARGIQKPDASWVGAPHSPHPVLQLSDIGDACSTACFCTDPASHHVVECHDNSLVYAL